MSTPVASQQRLIELRKKVVELMKAGLREEADEVRRAADQRLSQTVGSLRRARRRRSPKRDRQRGEKRRSLPNRCEHPGRTAPRGGRILGDRPAQPTMYWPPFSARVQPVT